MSKVYGIHLFRLEQMSKIRELNDQERVTIADERNAISDRAIQLESEIIEHIQGMGLST